MARGQWLTDEEVKRIHALARRGLTIQEIATRIRRSYYTVRRVLCGERPRAGELTKRRLSHLRLAHRISEPLNQEARKMTPQIVRNVFIDALLPAHFSKPRLAPEQFLADLTADLCSAGFDVPVLERAAHILRNERQGVFPKIPTVMAACRRAADAIADETVETQGQHTGTGATSASADESRPGQPKTRSREDEAA